MRWQPPSREELKEALEEKGNTWGPPITVNNGNSVMPRDDELVEASKRLIQSQHLTLWGRSFNVHDEEADEAAEWLAGQVRAVLRETWWPNRTS